MLSSKWILPTCFCVSVSVLAELSGEISVSLWPLDGEAAFAVLDAVIEPSYCLQSGTSVFGNPPYDLPYLRTRELICLLVLCNTAPAH